MRLRIFSDVHTEFHADGGRSFVAKLPRRAGDVAVLAGDIATSGTLFEALQLFAECFEQVIFVPGNHDWYGADRQHMGALRARVSRSLPGVHWLEESTAEIGEQRFVGTSLWFPDGVAARSHRRGMPDFGAITDFEQWIWSAFERSRTFLAGTLRSGDVVVSHHLPSPRSIAARFRGSPLNAYFLADVEDLIVRAQPRLWIHGHTHESLDYRIGGTRVVCNPFGYARMELNPNFDEELSIAITSPHSIHGDVEAW
jgi:Icc-related predicted phosphoesterase